MYLNGHISSSELYKRRNSYVISVDVNSLAERAKRLKDDSESQLTYSMITGMFKSETNGYLESLSDYISMVDAVTDKRYTRDEALTDIIITFEKVVTAITSLKEAIINKSNTIMNFSFFIIKALRPSSVLTASNASSPILENIDSPSKISGCIRS